jgi:hypothetical protein
MSEFKPGDEVAVKATVAKSSASVRPPYIEVGLGPFGALVVVTPGDLAPWVTPERIAALEVLWAWTEDMLDCADCEDGYCNRHHEEFIEVVRTLAALADPPGSRDREEAHG